MVGRPWPATDDGGSGSSDLLIESCDLGCDDLQACLSLDRLSLGGLWTAQQWHTELDEPARPVVGLRQQGVVGAGLRLVGARRTAHHGGGGGARTPSPGSRPPGFGSPAQAGARVGGDPSHAGSGRANVEARALYGWFGFQEAESVALTTEMAKMP